MSGVLDRVRGSKGLCTLTTRYSNYRTFMKLDEVEAGLIWTKGEVEAGLIWTKGEVEAGLIWTKVEVEAGLIWTKVEVTYNRNL